MTDSTKKLTLLSLYTAISLGIFVLESMLPPIIPIPGIKPGLANIITLIVLMKYTGRDALLVTLCRILLATFCTGNAQSFLYSIAGGLLSLGIMILVNKLLSGSYIYITSILGGIFHNIGQILVAIAVTSTPLVITYLPVLILSGIITGMFTGLCAYYTGGRIKG